MPGTWLFFSRFVSRSASTGVVSLLLLTAACSSEATLPEQPDSTGNTSQVTINTSAATEFKYYNLALGREVTVLEPLTDQGWDLALRRYEVRLNGGVAGSAGVSAVLLRDNTTQSTGTLLGYTAANQLAGFDSIGLTAIPPLERFSTTDLVATESRWFNIAGNTLVANPAAGWKMRLSNGGFALIRVASITLTNDQLSSMVVEYRLQENGALGTLRQLEARPTAADPKIRLSLAAGTAVTSGGCTWDLEVGREITLTVNSAGACGAGTFPLESTEDFTSLPTASGAPKFAPFISLMSGPVASEPTLEMHAPFIYGLDPANSHRLVPSFNIYLVRRGNDVYKVQFLSYYNPAGGESGFVTLRSALLR